MRERVIPWREFEHINFRGRGIHYKDTVGGKTKTGTIIRMEAVMIVVTEYVFVIERESGKQKNSLSQLFLTTIYRLNSLIQTRRVPRPLGRG